MPRSASVASAVSAARSRSRPSASSVSAAPALDDGGAVAVLGDRHAAGGDDQRDRGRDVERVVPVAAGAADVDRVGGRGDRDQPRAHRPRGAGDLGARSRRGRTARRGSAAIVLVRRLAVEHRAERRLGLGLVERAVEPAAARSRQAPSPRSRRCAGNWRAARGRARWRCFRVELHAVDRQRRVAEAHHAVPSSPASRCRVDHQRRRECPRRSASDSASR